MLDSLPKPLSSYRNLMFDLGGVLYQIQSQVFQQNIAALAERGGKEMDEREWGYFTNLAQRFESGLANPEGFIHSLRRQYLPDATPEEALIAWNSMLVGFYPGVEDWLRKLARRHRIFLLSNTNALHFNQIFAESDTFFEPFHRVLLSFELGVRKPDVGAYKLALDVAEIRASDTLFFDDSLANIEGAKRAGLHTVLVTDPLAMAQLANA